MTRIAVDIAASRRTLEQLRGARDGMQHGASELVRPHFGLFPPDVLAFMVAGQAQLSGGLRGGATAVQLQRRQIAARVAALQLADGGAIDPSIQAVLDERVEEPGIILPPGMLDTLLTGGDILAGLGDATDVLELALFGRLRVMELGLPKSSRTPFSVFDDYFQTRVVGKVGGTVLSAVGFGMSVKSNYEASGASTSFGRTVSAVVGAGFAARIPFVGLADAVTGGGVAASVDMNVVLGEAGVRVIMGDPAEAGRVLTKWSEDALAGKHGWAFQGVSMAGDSLGGALYDGSQALADAGERLGGSLHEAASEGKKLLNSVPRPKWLGGR